MNRIKLLKRLDQTDTRVSILNPGYSKLQLQSALTALNRETESRPMALDHSRWEWQEVDVTERQKELRRLVAMWERTNRNLDKLFRKNPDLQLELYFREDNHHSLQRWGSSARVVARPPRLAFDSSEDGGSEALYRASRQSAFAISRRALRAVWELLCEDRPSTKDLLWAQMWVGQDSC